MPTKQNGLSLRAIYTRYAVGQGLRQFVKSRTTLAFRDALRNVRIEAVIQRKHLQSLRGVNKLRIQPPYKIHLGCGPNVKPGWVNIDLFSKEADLHLDLREPLPFPDSSAELIYSEHFLEHLAYPDEVNRLLRESLRVLQSGGVFSVGVPDTAWPMQSYVHASEEYFRFSYEQGFLPNWCNTRMHVINEHFRGFGGHKYSYDLETLVGVLQQAGFVQITERSFAPSLDSELRKIGTLYVDAYKP